MNVVDFLNNKMDEIKFNKELKNFANEIIPFIKDLKEDKKNGIKIEISNGAITEDLKDPMANAVGTIELPDETFTWHTSEEKKIIIETDSSKIEIFDYNTATSFEVYKNDKNVLNFTSSFGKENGSRKLYDTVKVQNREDSLIAINEIKKKINQKPKVRLNNKNRF